MTRIKELFLKYKSFIMYAIFGVLTTVVNIFAYWLFAHALGMESIYIGDIKAGYYLANVIAWTISCTFAYITNRLWVFGSEAEGKKGVAKEALSFYVCRLATLGAETVFMYVFINLLGFNDMLIKVIANIIVIVLNYVFSKTIIFRKGQKENADQEEKL